ncbi:posphoenolpyruvate synthetase regulatory kinase/phosphorylase PpsR [Candidatus Berkiella aquae]|uniref:Putative phosphoenolpyruvate synthase regulatory protein n=1 Tax=Candidatus Berkiella aquae TaxID=295108 RepID=A0A0Q9YUP3_9GAMM|nr:pyruvate, water dikinase regulatory protein [Candidatus Berkiella aquae]
MAQRTVFFISDRTGITAETLGLSLISQFEGIPFIHVTLPFVDSAEKARETTQRINQAYQQDGAQPLVFATIVDPEIRSLLEKCDGFYIDFFKTFIPGLENELKMASANVMGRIHGVGDSNVYNTRIEAVNYALNYDDGARTNGYDTADVILVGVSRCGKTPTSLYLAMQFGIRAANYPITEEDLHSTQLPKALRPYQHKLFGLTIDPKRLHAIRSSRRPNSQYAQLAQCENEVKTVEAMFHQENIPYLSSTNLSIEELATKLMVISGIERRLR